jgi:molybdate transport system substrate-binding protein
MRLHRRTVLSAAATLAPLAATGQTPGPGPLIGAAADLKFALEALAEDFAAAGGGPVRLVFGSSGNLTNQIAQGAPFEIFLSADEALVQRLERLGRTRDGGHLYAVGRICVFAPHGSVLAVDPRLDGVAAALTAHAIRRFAIANPEHAPYGRAAQQALQRRGLWDAIRPLLVLGENVAQAAQFAAAGGTQGGIIAVSLSLAPAIARLGRFATIDAAWHEPLRQRMALIKGAGPTAERFYGFLRSGEARATLSRFGFELPPSH